MGPQVSLQIEIKTEFLVTALADIRFLTLKVFRILKLQYEPADVS